MGNFTHIKVDVSGSEAQLTLNRPDVHNAFNIKMIREINSVITILDQSKDIRLLTIKAEGNNFSAGADLTWMKEGMTQSREQLYSESLELAALFNVIYNSDKVVVVQAKGKSFGGALGILGAADIVIATHDASFSFSEVKLGLAPATIAPYIVRKCGLSAAKDWMLSGRSISADEGYARQLVNNLVHARELEDESSRLTQQILKNAPEALRTIKQMLRNSDNTQNPKEQMESSASMIAKLRISEEAQEGLSAFFEKRKPSWIKDE